MTNTQTNLALIESRFSNDPIVNRVVSEIKHGSRRYAQLFGTLFFDWPAAEEIIKRFIAHISDLIPNAIVNGVPVIYQIVTDALDKYGELVYFANEDKHRDATRIYGFIQALITGVEDHLNVVVADEKGNTWTVMSEEGFSEWTDRLQNVKTLVTSPNQNVDIGEVRQHLFNLVSCENIKKLMRNTGYEQALVDGRLVSCL